VVKSITESMVLWENGGGVKVVPRPYDDMVKYPEDSVFSNSWGGCNAEVHEMTPEQRKTAVFIEATHLILRDKVPADAVHREFLKLEEYRDGLNPDWLRSL